MRRKKSKRENSAGQYCEMDIYESENGTRIVINDYTRRQEASEVVLCLARAVGVEFEINSDSPCG